MWSLTAAKQPCLTSVARCTSHGKYARNRLLTTTGSKNATTTPSFTMPHDEEVQGLANTLRESLTRLNQKYGAAENKSGWYTFRLAMERSRPQMISLIVSSGAVLLGIRSYYYQKTSKILQHKVDQQQEEIQRKNEVLVSLTSEDFVKSLAEKCAAVTDVSNNNSSTTETSKSYFWSSTKSSVGKRDKEKSNFSVLYQILIDELSRSVGDEVLSESERDEQRKAKLEDEQRSKTAAVRADNETKLEQLRKTGSELPEIVMQEIKDSSEPFEVTTDETGNRVVRNKVFRI